MTGLLKAFGLSALAFASSLPLWGGDLDLGRWSQDFESRLPGEAPQGWRVLWGSMPPCDSIAVSNMESLSGRRSMLLERVHSETDVTQYGFSCVTSALPKSGEALLSIPFKVYGSGSEASFSIEIREPGGQGRIVNLYFNNGDVGAKGKGEKRSGNIGPIRFGVWQRVLLSIPTGPDVKDISALLESRQPDGSWLQEKPVDSVTPLRRVEGGKGLCIMLCAGIGKGPYKVYFDALSLEELSPPGN